MRSSLLLILAICLTGCSSATRVGIDHRMSDEREQLVELAMFRWNMLAGWTALQLAENETPDVWVVEQVPRAPGVNGSYTASNGKIRIRPGLPLEAFKIVAMHELGHALFGPNHTATGVMSGAATDAFSADDEDHCEDEGVCR